MRKHGPKIWGNWSANWDFKVFVKSGNGSKIWGNRPKIWGKQSKIWGNRSF